VKVDLTKKLNKKLNKEVILKMKLKVPNNIIDKYSHENFKYIKRITPAV
jgi:hypothetical protein